ncbi:MAG: DUF4278 domain-containing protein [Candidatus Nanopelagicaceae bacterium]
MLDDSDIETRNSIMQLTYRGQNYTPSTAFISHSIEGIYRGVHYRYDSEPAKLLFQGLTYRGISELSCLIPATAVA